MTPVIKRLQLLLMLLLISVLMGCASTVSKGVKVTDEDLAKYDSLSAEQSFTRYEGLLTEARNAQMPLLAPHYFAEAADLLVHARDDMKRYGKKNRMVQLLAKGEGILQKGQGVMQRVSSQLATELALREALLQLQADKHFSTDYKAVNEDLLAVIETIELEEKDKLDKARKALLAAMQALEVRAIKYNALHQAQQIIAQAREADAGKLAPKTLDEAQRVYQQAEQAIDQQPHDKALVAEHSNRVLFAARHLKYVLAQVVALEAQYKKSPESVVLDEELRLKQIADALQGADVRDRPLAEQANVLAGDVAAQRSAGGQQQEQLAAPLRQQLQELQAAHTLLQQKRTVQDQQILGLSEQLVRLNNELKSLRAGEAVPQEPPPPEPAAPSADGQPAP